jgi:hypothetical protein
MGAWGVDAFDNDDAMDWVVELEASRDFSVVESTLDAVAASGGQYLEAPQCCQVLAAAEVVAALAGKPAQTLPPEVTAWLKGKSNPSTDLAYKARHSIEPIVGDSELKDMWSESGEDQQWKASIADLQVRLSSNL